jgi:SulP family sulfate permease
MAGILLLIMGFSRLGGMIKFIPFPVVTGFTAGIAVVIFSTQIKDLLGLGIDDIPAEFHHKWIAYGKSLGSINWSATTIGIATIAIIVLIRKVAPRVPAMLVAMVLAALATSLLSLPVETIGSRFGELPRSLPAPQLPSFTLQQVRELASPALTVALLAAIESLLSATVADGMMGTRHKSNIELVAQGAANISSAMFGGIPATGAIARTATNIKSGARTPVNPDVPGSVSRQGASRLPGWHFSSSILPDESPGAFPGIAYCSKK